MRGRNVWVIAVHLGLWAVSLGVASALRFELAVPPWFAQALPAWLAILLVARLAAFTPLGLFRGLWRYTGARDLVAIVAATTAGTVVFTAGVALLPGPFPRSVPVIEWLCALTLVGGVRFASRALRSRELHLVGPRAWRERVLVLGAGDAGELLVREIRARYAGRWEPVGFLDDDPRKHGGHIHGARVHGPIGDLARAVAELRADLVVIAMPSATGAEMRRAVAICNAAGITPKTLPGIDQLIDGRTAVTQLRDVQIEDLLGRDPVRLDEAEVSAAIRGQVVMITGAGGSIGSEVCRQVRRFGPAALVLVERAENALFQIHRELEGREGSGRLVPCLADIGDAARIRALLAAHRPTVIFHAAAHKHVPMMEWNPGEAVKNNVIGTRVLADAAHEAGVGRFVMISTDKAVNPSSVMGASKRIAEMYVQALSQRSHTRFVTVRFGNVLGSAGSVIPIFREQIAGGGPVTVTHPEMRRYFMTIPEASQLVLQAGAMGHGGEIFILDMGEPVRIVDLAREVITLSGFRPDVDVKIEYTGVRPGEKLFEELSVKEEDAVKTRHPKIYVGRFRPHSWEIVQRHLRDLGELADARPQDIRRKLSEVVPEYRPAMPVAVVREQPAAAVAEELGVSKGGGGSVAPARARTERGDRDAGAAGH
jgi:FlaA1/EpsC-like NDP-sugar epimerase